MELSLILPILILITAAGIDFSMVLRSKQLLSVVSREAGSNAFKDCYVEADPTQLRSCLDNLITGTEMQDLIEATVPGAVLGISVYDRDAFGTTSQTVLEPATFSTRYTAATVGGSGSGVQVLTLAGKDRIIIAEVTATHDTYFPYPAGINATIGDLYEATIF